MGDTSIRFTVHSKHRVVVLVKERHIVVVTHRLSGLDTLHLLHNDAIALHDDLAEARQRLTSLGQCRVGPCEMSRQRNIAVNVHLQVIGALGHIVVNIVGHEVGNNGLATAILEALAVNEQPSISRTTPTKVEVEQAVHVVTVADEGVATVVTVT